MVHLAVEEGDRASVPESGYEGGGKEEVGVATVVSEQDFGGDTEEGPEGDAEGSCWV